MSLSDWQGQGHGAVEGCRRCLSHNGTVTELSKGSRAQWETQGNFYSVVSRLLAGMALIKTS